MRMRCRSRLPRAAAGAEPVHLNGRDGNVTTRKCVEYGSSENLRFDYIIPYSRNGYSLVAENIQLIRARHNLAEHDKIR